MENIYISGTGYWKADEVVTNDEIVASYNSYVERFNKDNNEAIEAGTVEPLGPSSVEFIEKASGYACERQVFGRAIGQNQGIQFPIAKAYSQMRAAELMLHEAIKLYDAGQNPGEEANLAKLLAAEAQWAAAEACLQTHGGFGFAEEYDIERKFREARLYQVAPISTNLILSYIAEHVLKMPRSY